ncbi:MAG: phage portal protein [Sphaerochaeta sp.]|jgi:HK97 family phage portal protein|nr:phage portal protein [Sphaerochaeta sp.]
MGNIRERIASFIGGRAKSYDSGGFELLRRLTGGSVEAKGLETYRTSLYVFAVVSRIATKAASVPFRLYRVKGSKGDQEELTAHPVIDLFYRPNPTQTRSEFVEMAFTNLLLTGEAFVYKVRNSRGVPVELMNLRPDRMTVVAGKDEPVARYEFARNDGTRAVFATEDIIHVKLPNPFNQLSGLSPLVAGSRRVETEIYASTEQRDLFLNSARPDALLKVAGGLGKDDRDELRAGWNRRHQGPGKNGKVAVLSGDVEYQQISLSPKELDHIESMRLLRDDIFLLFSVPKSAMGVTEDVNRANAEVGMELFLTECVGPHLTRWWEKMNEEMIIPDFGDEYWIEPVEFTQGGEERKLARYANGIANRWLLINEVRAMEGLPPVKGGWTLYGSLAEMPIGGLDQSAQKAIDDEARENERVIRAHASPRFGFRGRSMLKAKLEVREAMLAPRAKSEPRRLIAGEARKAYCDFSLKRMEQGEKSLRARVDEFAAGQAARVAKALDRLKSKAVKVTVSRIFDRDKEDALAVDFLLPELRSILERAGEDALDLVEPQTDFDMTARIERAIKSHAAKLAEEVNRTTVEGLGRDLAEGLAQGEGIGEISGRVAARFEEFPLWRSDLIARTETTNALNQGLEEGFRQSDVTNAKEWVATMDDRTRDEHLALDGEVVKLGEAFSNGLQRPGEPNCRCAIAPAFIED